MDSVVRDRAAASLPDGECYARNLIGGRWQFPAAPYEFEIRDPGDSTITAVVPLSSRFDAGAAFAAASGALQGTWAEADARAELLRALLDRLDASRMDLAQLQCTETGVSSEDSLNAVSATLAVARALLPGAVGAPAPRRGVSGHILSWGLPFTEAVTSVFPAIARGDTVIVKPSLRGPLTPAAFAFLATEAGLPGGVVNIVQGTGVDIGADLITRRGLAALHVRAGERTIALAGRGQQRTGVALHVLRGGGNLMIAGPGSHDDAGALADAVVAGVRMHSSGGPFGLPLLAVHRGEAGSLLPAILEQLSRTVAAPLPTEPLRRRALGRIRSLVDVGAEALLGGRDLPDDVAHRMGWRIPPTVLMLGAADSPAARAERASVPLGPVLGVITWNRWEELGAAFTAARSRDGIASVCGAFAHAGSLPHGLVIRGVPAVSLLDRATLPAAWLGGVR
jgi:acyl-CoA reductase-like NAD-dependent aldehyde dehydrogenase